ncbi:S-layer homology domain-containing protein [Meiothermus rufus]|uniref:S-layer homology domain-containing protein n=1 Tax=Meiothermus rufus TaxID=604332 RepID=UPI0006843A7C|nr:S-layer homology domain-containing protein [Meiothermus rufus]
MRLLLVLGMALAQGAPRGRFVDVPPCHWAAEAVRVLAARGLFQGYPATARELAENALRQVFEGLRCGETSWSLEFLEGAPPSFGAAPRIDGFELRGLQTRLSGDRGTIAFEVVVSQEGVVYTRRGTARLVFVQQGWKVLYEAVHGSGWNAQGEHPIRRSQAAPFGPDGGRHRIAGGGAFEGGFRRHRPRAPATGP